MKEKPRHPEKVNKPFNPIKRKPEWIRSKMVDSQIFFQTKQIVNQNYRVLSIRPQKVPLFSLFIYFINVADGL